ncbi:MAG TPA: ribonuclease P protein component [Alphaproteobacteria bacterium]|nr:ribonuclease P protein component [Alphaproteobacteria bacterium]
MAVPVGRLKRRPEFLRVAASRRKWATPGLILQAMERTGAEPCEGGAEVVRVGLTASRKVGGAVARNRARRRLREAARRVVPELALPGYDLVLIARAGTLTRAFTALVGDLETALRRLKAARRAADDGGARRV